MVKSREKYPPEQLVAALKENSGLVYVTADKLGIAASTIYRAADRHPAVNDAIEHQKGVRLDTAESMLYKAVEKGEAWAVCFFLKTQGRRRGYTERLDELPPLEVLLAALPIDVADVVRKALAAAVHGGGDTGRRPAVGP